MFYKKYLEILIVAQTIYGEARSDGYHGMLAVANVIKNRVRHKDFPNSYIGVCLQKYQFSMWNDMNEANTQKALNADKTDASFKMALEIASGVINGKLQDNTNGADHYHTIAMGFPKSWDRRFIKPTGDIGSHRFYKHA